MKSAQKVVILSGILIIAGTGRFHSGISDHLLQYSNATNLIMQPILIDKFIVPQEAKEEFINRLDTNLDFIRTLPGFVKTAVYEQTGGEGEFNFVTTAFWESNEALVNARTAVTNEYQKQGFDPPEMFERLNIRMDRAVYREKTTISQSPEKNKQVVRRLYEECLNKREFSLLKELVDEDYTGISGETGPSGFGGSLRSIIRAFPDIRWTIEALVAEGDKVTVRWSWQGVHTDTFRNIFPPTQKHVTDHAIAIYQFRDNKIINAWIQTDRLGFLQQIGVIPGDLRELPLPWNE
ncbi:MAG: ester cyclase [Balneolaceae bacterium]